MKLAKLCCLLLVCLLPFAAEAQVNKRVLLAGKGATGLVLLDGNRGSGSCFCVDSEGYFVTNAHVVRGEVGATIIMNPNTDDQFELKAKVVVSDRTSDLALLKADMGKHKVTPLRLADSEKLTETDELIAFGFPLGELLAFDEDEYPAVSVNVGRVTSLRKADGKLEAIQTDTTLTFGNSGGPMLDKNGDVAGVVVAGLPGLNINFAIPTSKVDKLLKMPAVSVTLPDKIAYGKRYEPVGVKIEVDDISKTAGAGPFSVKVFVGDGEDAKTVKAMGRGGSFVAGIQPAEKPKGEGPADEEFEVDLQFDTGSMTVKLQNVPLRVGKHRLKLHEVALVEKRGGTYRVIKTDGTELEGSTLTGPTVTTEFAGERTRVALSKASWIRVFHDGLEQGKGFAVPLTIEVSRGGEVVAVYRAALRIEDPPKLDLPDAPSGDTAEPRDEPRDDRDTPRAPVARGDYRFDARRDRTLKGWDMSLDLDLPSSVKGELDFSEINRSFELTFQKQVQIESLTIEFETTPGTRGGEFKVSYGDNVYRVNEHHDWIGMSETRLTYRLDRELKTELDNKVRFTIDFPASGLTRLSSGKAELYRGFMGPGELKLHIPNPHGIKLHRIDLKMKSGEGMVAQASSYEPPADAEEVKQDDTTITLPDAYASFEVGGGGRYMLFHIPSKGTVEIVDIVEGKIVHTLDNMPDDLIIAAGQTKFVLVLPSQRLFQRWSFEGFNREKVSRLPGEGETRVAALGTNSEGPLLLGSDVPTLVDLDSMRPIDIKGNLVGKQGDRDRNKIFPSADGKVFLVMQYQEYHLLRIEGEYAWSKKFFNTGHAHRFAHPTADGRLILARHEGVLDLALNKIPTEWKKQRIGYPSTDPRYFLGVSFYKKQTKKNRDQVMDEINICTTADRRTVHTVVMPTTADYNTFHTGHIWGGDPQYHYVHWAKALITVNWSKKALRVRKVDFLKQFKEQGIDYLYVQSVPPVFAPRGGRLSYQIDVVSSSDGITYELFDGPAGCKISDAGLVTWNIPMTSEREKETIILSVRNKAGEEVLHSFDLTYQ